MSTGIYVAAWLGNPTAVVTTLLDGKIANIARRWRLIAPSKTERLLPHSGDVRFWPTAADVQQAASSAAI